jgi:hypothetical protein
MSDVCVYRGDPRRLALLAIREAASEPGLKLEQVPDHDGDELYVTRWRTRKLVRFFTRRVTDSSDLWVLVHSPGRLPWSEYLWGRGRDASELCREAGVEVIEEHAYRAWFGTDRCLR